jgi:RHS repeat-associated protein
MHAFSTMVLKFVRNCQTAAILPLMAIRNAISPLKITYPGTGNNSQFAYNGYGRTVKIVETISGSISSTKQFIWGSGRMREVRDGNSMLVSQYFSYGQTIIGSSYFFTKDHLGSVRELVDSSGNIQAQYSYDTYGRTTKSQGSLDADLQYSGYYFHAPSGLDLTVHRPYKSSAGRWISRDPMGEASGANLYDYVQNSPTQYSDPEGLQEVLIRLPWVDTPIVGGPGSGFIDPFGIVLPLPDPNKPNAPPGTTGNPHWECTCHDAKCCKSEMKKCDDGCGYWYGDDGAASPDGNLYRQCIYCCLGKSGDCNKSRGKPAVGFGSCFSQGKYQPNTGGLA